MTAYFSIPNDNSDPVVSFHARADADDFAGAYGGTVEAVGVVFVVRGADVASAKADIKSGDGDWRKARLDRADAETAAAASERDPAGTWSNV